MTTTSDAAAPFFLRGNYAPVPDEVTAETLPVTGAIPPELHGLSVRTRAMPPHPKLAPGTAELHSLGSAFGAPYLPYHAPDAAGTLARSEAIAVPGPTRIHAFTLTEHHGIFMDLPVVFDIDLAMQGT